MVIACVSDEHHGLMQEKRYDKKKAFEIAKQPWEAKNRSFEKKNEKSLLFTVKLIITKSIVYIHQENKRKAEGHYENKQYYHQYSAAL